MVCDGSSYLFLIDNAITKIYKLVCEKGAMMMEIGWQDIRDLGYRNYDEYLYYCEEEEDCEEYTSQDQYKPTP